MIVRLAVVLAAFPAVFLSACGPATPEWCSPIDAATRTVESGTPNEARLVPKWRFDGNQDGNELLEPVSASLNPETHVLALSDFRLAEIIIISDSGSLTQRWARHGEGPGEMKVPTAVAWADDSTVVAFDPLNQKLVRIRLSGTADDQGMDRRFSSLITSSSLSWITLQPNGTIVAAPMPSLRSEAEAEFVVVRGGLPGSPIDTLIRATIPLIRPERYQPMPAPLWPMPLAALSGDTLIALAGDGPEYRIRILDGSGRVRFQICRNVDPLPEEPYEFRVPFGGQSRDMPALTLALEQAPRPDRPATIGRLMFDAIGRLWVQRNRPSVLSTVDLTLGREGALFDLYGAEGEYLGAVQAPPRVRILDATDELVIGLETGEFDVLSVVAYRIAW